MAEITVVIADNDPLARSAISAIISRDPAIMVVGEATNGREAVEIAQRLRPQVVLMDLQMPEVDGITATRALAQDDTCDPDLQTHVLVLTGFRDGSTIDSLRAGASGFLLKRSHASFVQAVKEVAAGESWIDPAVSNEVLSALRTGVGLDRRSQEQLISRLTDREREILALMVTGLYNEEIAHRLDIALTTVKTHVTRVRTKTGSRNRVEAVLVGLRSGLVPLYPD